MNPFMFLEGRAREVRAAFLKYSEGQPPRIPLSAEHVIAIRDYADEAGFSPTGDVIKVLGKFCHIRKAARQSEFLALHYDLLMDARLHKWYQRECDLSPVACTARFDDGLLALAAKFVPFVVGIRYAGLARGPR